MALLGWGTMGGMVGCSSSDSASGDEGAGGGFVAGKAGASGKGGKSGAAGSGGAAGDGTGATSAGGTGGASASAGTSGSAGANGSSGANGASGSSGMAGAAGTVGCGDVGQTCCDPAACSGFDLFCDTSNTCKHCGLSNEPCCGQSCSDGLSCTDGSCVCGGVGQACCSATFCDNDLTCEGGAICTCPSTCTADNQGFLDCHGQSTACASNQSCIDGACVDPCVTAAADHSSVGCDFWALRTEAIAEVNGACFVVFVANTWSAAAHITADYNGQALDMSAVARIPVGQGVGLSYAPYDPVAGLAPGEVAILSLSRGDGSLPACPGSPPLGDISVSGTGIGSAIHLGTDRPVAMYQMLPYGGGSAAATSATLLLPTATFAQSYLAIDPYAAGQSSGGGVPSVSILASQDNTTITVTPKPGVSVNGGGGIPGGSAPFNLTLNRGQYAQISQGQELTGSVVKGDKPIALWGAAGCFNVPVYRTACDTAQQQIPPLNALGSTYVGLRYRGRGGDTNESVPWRLVGGVDGTSLTWEPSTPAGAPTTLSAGQVVEFDAPGPFVVRSQDVQFPFYAAGYMTGGDIYNGEGDPEWVNLIPPDQYLSHYVLFTDPTYSETELEVVRAPDENGNFSDVTLECTGALTGWQPIGAYQFVRVPLVTGNFSNVGGCSNGRHEMSSGLPFGVTVWGWGSVASSGVFTQYVSYAYPAGAAVKKINDKGD